MTSPRRLAIPDITAKPELQRRLIGEGETLFVERKRTDPKKGLGATLAETRRAAPDGCQSATVASVVVLPDASGTLVDDRTGLAALQFSTPLATSEPVVPGSVADRHPVWSMADPFREPVELSAIDPAWPQQYAEEAAHIEQALAGLVPEIDHIGSTSVPLRAKPIIDIQVAVAQRHVAAVVMALRGLGYAHHGQGGVPGREYLTKRRPERPAVNVHVFSSDNRLAADNRMIRDYLRANPKAAEQYAQAKQRAVEQGHVELLTYSDAKRSHVAALRNAALAWARRSDL